jgi:hypothetical protein
MGAVMKELVNKKMKESLRYTLACYAGNVSLTLSCPIRLKENLAFLHDYVRRGRARDALGCMVENIFMGDPNDRRLAAVIKWYDHKHPGSAPIILGYLNELAGIEQASHTVHRIRHRLHVHKIVGIGKKPQNRLKKVVGI